MTLLKPVNDNLIIQLPPVENVTESGFMIPESAVKPPQTATVIAVSDEQTKVGAGDQVIIRQHAGQTFEHQGDTYQLIHLSDVMAIIS